MSPYRFTNILVAIDGSDDAAKALDCALSIAEALGIAVAAHRQRVIGLVGAHFGRPANLHEP